jgi:uncharacterized protein YrzB (UPF0473 family)
MKNENKLIAEFMGYKVVDKPKVVNGENFFEYIDENGNYTYCNSLLRYNDQWDWLMLVVEKIESDERYDVDILQYGTRITDNQKEIVNNIANISFDKKIDHTYQAVVEFIKTYKNK